MRVNIRPYARHVLRLLSQFYQVIVFTASHYTYANTILDYLDPTGELLAARYYRDSCHTSIDKVHIKDLRIFDRDLKDVILVDNAAHCFGLQITNGIPMLPFFEDKADREMIHLYHYLVRLACVQDVRPVIRETFCLAIEEPGFYDTIEGVVEYCVEEVIEDVEDSPVSQKSVKKTSPEKRFSDQLV